MTAVIEVTAPPEVPRSGSSSPLALVVPIVMAIAMLGVTGAGFLTGTPTVRNPTFIAFPAMMSVSLLATALTGRSRRRGAALNAERDWYFSYLGELRDTVTHTAAAQHRALISAHPDPDTLWTLVGGPRMWVPVQPELCHVRIGIGQVPLATRLVAVPAPAACDPVSDAARQRFLGAHSTLEAPVVIALNGKVTIDGDPGEVRDLIRAIVCRLAVAQPPGQLLIAVACDRNPINWDWLKWLPHNRRPAGAEQLTFATVGEAGTVLAAVGIRAVLVVDSAEPASSIPGVILLVVGAEATSLTVRHGDQAEAPPAPDRLDAGDALACARRLAAYGNSVPRGDDDWASLLGIDNLRCAEPKLRWRNGVQRRHLRVPIGTTAGGQPVQLDINEAAEGGIGPHGLCVGATGSGKSELLRTVALGMMACNPPDVLNLLLIDFKGGAAFLDFAGSPQVAAVVTNLADEAPLVARMRDALAGEMNRRQQLLRMAGAASITAYNQAPSSVPLPALFIIVDEFSELLSQHPDFADTFVAIGRLGRSLGMHLLLASQRLDEGRLRGLDAHLSYRICLKTLSASESRAVLGTLDAYELPATPGVGFLRAGSAEPVRFRAAYVSGLLRAEPVEAQAEVRRFTAEPVGAGAPSVAAPQPSVLHSVLDRLAGHGPPAHQVWLPPLSVAPPLSALLDAHAGTRLTVPLGVVDRPYQQCRTPLLVDLSGAAGNVAVVGAPRAGKSTALRTLITALAATHEPEQVQFYCMDFGGGTLSAVGDLPHVGDLADRAAPQLVWRMVAEMESAVRAREAPCGARGNVRPTDAEIFLVIDGWATLCRQFEGIDEKVTAIAGQGLSFGVHVVLSTSRWADLRPALKDQIGTRIELRLGDPADSEIDRGQARHVPPDRPGRGLSRDGKHMLIALPDGVGLRRGAGVAPPIPLLPDLVDYPTVIAASDENAVLGIEEHRLQPLTIDFDTNRHLLILGDNGCGKTAALRVLCREIVRTNTAAQARLFIVDFRRTLLGLIDSEHRGGYAMSPAALGSMLPELVATLRDRRPGADVTEAQLRARAWWTGSDIYLVVDDYDLAAGSLSALLEYLPYATDLGLHVIVARRSGGAARALFDPLLAGLRDLGCLGMLMSGQPEEGPLLGSGPPVPLPPGRGRLITRPGVEQMVQVAWSPPP